MKPLDYNKPLRFSTTHESVHYVGIELGGKHVLQIGTTQGFLQVDGYGRSVAYHDVENVPEKIVRWIVRWIVTRPEYGYETKEGALEWASSNPNWTVVRIEYEEGQRP
jgi:hypothetical protein